MSEAPIVYGPISDLYDVFVRVDFDIPFFVQKTSHCEGEVLELMSGTGRLSVPLDDYDRSTYQAEYSPFMIWIMRKG